MNPIEAAVLPLKQDAIESARLRITRKISQVLDSLEEANWDAQIVAPYPNSRTDFGNVYHEKLRDYRFVRSITTSIEGSRRVNDPEYRRANQELIDHVIKMWEDLAAEQYEMFVGKLIGKIGECVSAELEGNHVWGYSVLHITKADGTKEKWKTQMIYKLSKLGKPHNQWPTRKVK